MGNGCEAKTVTWLQELVAVWKLTGEQYSRWVLWAGMVPEVGAWAVYQAVSSDQAGTKYHSVVGIGSCINLHKDAFEEGYVSGLYVFFVRAFGCVCQ